MVAHLAVHCALFVVLSHFHVVVVGVVVVIEVVIVIGDCSVMR